MRGRLRPNTTIYDGWQGVIWHGNDNVCYHVAVANGALQLFPPGKDNVDLRGRNRGKKVPCVGEAALLGETAWGRGVSSACDHIPVSPHVLERCGLLRAYGHGALPARCPP